MVRMEPVISYNIISIRLQVLCMLTEVLAALTLRSFLGWPLQNSTSTVEPYGTIFLVSYNYYTSIMHAQSDASINFA